MKCAYDGKPATRIDLCHGRTPLCDDQVDIGHQYEILPLEPDEKPRSRTARAERAEVKAEAKE